MVHGFVKQSGGHIRIYSEVGQGTVVKIYLPRLIEVEQSVAVPRGALVDTQAVRGANAGETVLIVEDDGSVRNYATDALEDLGYQVLVASSGDEALLQASRVDLLFTDVVLGGALNGRQLAEEIVKLGRGYRCCSRPDIRATPSCIMAGSTLA